MKSKYRSKKKLRKRGWRGNMVEVLLRRPDMFAEDTGEALYLRSRIREVEKTIEFKDLKKRIDEQRKAQRKASVEEKKKKYLAEVASKILRLPDMSLEEAIQAAIINYNERLPYLRRKYVIQNEPVSEKTNSSFLYHITVNYLRHNVSDYSYMLCIEDRNRVGYGEAYIFMKGRILDIIAKQHLELADECTLQKAKFDRESSSEDVVA